MALYDIFISQEHPPAIRRLMVWLNRSIVSFLRSQLRDTDRRRPLKILEVGPGKGYFHRACAEDGNIEYFALDRNPNILNLLGDIPETNKFYGEVPELPTIPIKFDVIYAAFVLEHLLGGGESQFAFMSWAKKHVAEGGIIAFQVPDAEKLGMEFWNIDYTHTFPTTKRSVAHALYDNQIYDVDVYEVNGLLTHPFFTNRWITLLLRTFFCPYQYKVMQWLAYYLFGKPSWRQGDIFFSAYGLCKEPNLFVVGRVPSQNLPAAHEN
jgi:SAM-dependent methyltransferase